MMKKLTISLILMSLFLILSVNAASVSKVWSCGNGLSCSTGYCGLRHDIYQGNSDSGIVNLYFNANPGNYNCQVSVIETEYSYHDHDPAAPQKSEFSDVWLNSIYAGRTVDAACNSDSCGYGCSCYDCTQKTNTFNLNVNLNSYSNNIKLQGYQSHGLLSVSISCSLIQPTPTPSPEVCDGIDNDCDGAIDEGGVCCGDGILYGLEQCETAGTDNNPYCSQSTTSCSGYKTGTRDSSGYCAGACYCVEDDFNYQCVQGSCGATCDSNDDCNDGNIHTIDTCTLSCSCQHVQQAYCGDGNIDAGEECDDGNNINNDGCSANCEIENFECYSNNDCGTNGFFGNVFCNGYDCNDLYQNYISYTCNNPGTINAHCSNSISQILVEDCGDDEQIPSTNYCIGDNAYYDITYYNRGCNYGACYEQTSTQTYLVEQCTDTCYEGECIDFTCDEDSDCGTDVFVGDAYCNGPGCCNDVYQNYLTYTCNNPGTINAYCSSEINSILKQDCGDDEQVQSTNYCIGDDVYYNITNYDRGCSNAECFEHVSTQTYLAEDCVDTCYQGECVEIICYDDNDCGTPSTVEFCNGLDFIEQTTTPICYNEATPSSYCGAEISSVAEGCSYICDYVFGCDYTECSDSIDNDGDSDIDYPQDLGCDDYYDDDESDGHVICSSDIECGTPYSFTYCSGLIFGTNTTTPTCKNPGTEHSYCVDISQLINSELCYYLCSATLGCDYTECSDKQDNDGDGLIDMKDPGCVSYFDDDESDVKRTWDIIPRKTLLINNIRFNREVLPEVSICEDGQLYVDLQFTNIGIKDMKKATIRVTIEELGISRKLGPFNGPEVEEVMGKGILLDIPKDAQPGTYTVRTTLSDVDGIKRTRHRDFILIN